MEFEHDVVKKFLKENSALIQKRVDKILEENYNKKFNRKINKDIELMAEIINSEEVLDKEVKAFSSGSSGYISLPKKWIGRTVKIIILNEEVLG